MCYNRICPLQSLKLPKREAPCAHCKNLSPLQVLGLVHTPLVPFSRGAGLAFAPELAYPLKAVPPQPVPFFAPGRPKSPLQRGLRGVSQQDLPATKSQITQARGPLCPLKKFVPVASVGFRTHPSGPLSRGDLVGLSAGIGLPAKSRPSTTSAHFCT